MLTNRKPMKRTGFARPERAEKVAAVLRPIRQLAPVQAAKLPVQTPKFEYVRSTALLEACRKIPCQGCGIDDGTVVAAHSNSLIHGKARGKKASDQFVASLCFKCHHEIDQGSKLSAGERQLIWYLAHLATVGELTSRGLWPANVPVPDQWIEEGQ